MSLGVQGVLSRMSELGRQLGLTPPAATVETTASAARGTDFATTLAGATGDGTALTGSVAAVRQDLAAGAAGLTALRPTTLRPAGLQNGTPLTGVPYADIFTKAGNQYGVSPQLLAAVAKVESNYDPQAVSRSGAQGLMQLMPTTAAGLGVQDSFDPQSAITGAAQLLAQHLEEFNVVPLALAAYNAGGGAVHRYGGIPPFAETQAYVSKVLTALAALGG